MSALSLLPFQTAFDPPQQAEGSLDPLGLYSIADALGVRLAPGVRERQSKPRYLTLALAGFSVCQGTLQELGSQKGLPAWMAFEWLVVQALVKCLGGTPELQGIPGREKVAECVRRGEPVCASNYLKSPAVFGFHGVYRVLGVKAGLFDADGNPLERGRRVLQAWQQDQKLNGFLDGAGEGREMRRSIERAVRAGIEAGRMAAPAKAIAEWIAAHLNPHRPGARERDALWSALTQSDALRGEYAALVTGGTGPVDWQGSDDSEAGFHKRLLSRASLPMRHLLQTIHAFERLARLLTDAFDEVRWNLSQEGRPVAAERMASGPCIQRASREGAAALRDTLQLLGEVDPVTRIRAEAALSWVGEPANAVGFATQLLAHHTRVQRAKPPNGKRSWFDTFGDGRIAIRPAYELEDFDPPEGEYVHAYRTRPLWSFAIDLGRVHIAKEPQ